LGSAGRGTVSIGRQPQSLLDGGLAGSRVTAVKATYFSVAFLAV